MIKVTNNDAATNRQQNKIEFDVDAARVHKALPTIKNSEID
ncbi:hypothetical protein BVRB_4g094780 [Beta vulgaris subsp. vulgaris]|nr:hypothetical protein BVRB_4g094780 [Beta vulgaris subsp. vulgaris]